MNVFTETIDFIQYIIIDLFCGAGGTTEGFEKAILTEQERQALLMLWGVKDLETARKTISLAKVVAGINHNPIAIESHGANHPHVWHSQEDITKLYGVIKAGILLRSAEFQRLIRLIEIYRAFYPNAKIILWASLECTNFSKAKGGQSRDADSRTLADHLEPYIIALDPHYVKIENVVEFLKWGPLDEEGKQVKELEGTDFERWRKVICGLGYYDEWKQLNSADFGAYTSRNRLFGCFAKEGLPIVWPEPTHTKNPDKTPMFKRKKWEPVKKVLDFDDEGKTIFNRKKPLSTKTMQRLFMGCVRHIAGGKEHFLSKAYSGKPWDKNVSLDRPAPVITTIPHEQLVKACFVSRYNGVNGGLHDNCKSIDDPIGALGTKDNYAKVEAHFIQTYYSPGCTNSIDEPAATLRTKDCLSKVSALFFIDKQYFGSNNHQSIESPAGAILTNDKHKLVKAEKWLMNTNYNNIGSSLDSPAPVITADRHYHYLVNPSWGGNPGSVDQPCPVVIARQDKAPLYLVTCQQGGAVAVPIYEGDCEWTIRIKEFMALYNICDIKMRMLKMTELKPIQGFPIDYILMGTQADQKKSIGNAVHTVIPNVWAKAFNKQSVQHLKMSA